MFTASKFYKKLPLTSEWNLCFQIFTFHIPLVCKDYYAICKYAEGKKYNKSM